MKFSININQKAAVDSGLSLDIVDLAIFDFIKDFVLTRACRKVIDKYGEWFWISNKIIIEQMPVLGITTEKGMRKHMNKLCSEGVLERHPDCVSAKKSLYKLGEKFEELLFTGNDCSGSLGTNVPSNREQMFQVTGNDCSEYNNIEDNNIKDNYIENNRERARAKERREDNLFDCDGNGNESAITVAPAVPQERKIARKERSTVSLFRESEAAKLVSYLPDGSPDASKLFAMFPGERYKNVDMLYYYEAVADWSDSADKKRTARGWIATIRRFVEMDRERGKVHMIFPAGAKTAIENFIDDMTIPEGY